MAVASRFTVALHALTWIAEMSKENTEHVPSDRIAESVGTSPVFIRRILGMLGRAHLVSVKHGGKILGGSWQDVQKILHCYRYMKRWSKSRCSSYITAPRAIPVSSPREYVRH